MIGDKGVKNENGDMLHVKRGEQPETFECVRGSTILSKMRKLARRQFSGLDACLLWEKLRRGRHPKNQTKKR